MPSFEAAPSIRRRDALLTFGYLRMVVSSQLLSTRIRARSMGSNFIPNLV
jgi:hypothetical protein